MHALEARLKALMLASLAGSHTAYRQLLREAEPLVRSFLINRVGMSADVDDLLQEVLIAVHTHRANYQPEQLFTAWLYAIARHKLADAVRHDARRRHVRLEDAPERIEADHGDRVAARLDVDRLLDALPCKQRAAIRCVKLRQWTVADTSARTGMSQSAIKLSIHRGLNALVGRRREATAHGDE